MQCLFVNLYDFFPVNRSLYNLQNTAYFRKKNDEILFARKTNHTTITAELQFEHNKYKYFLNEKWYRKNFIRNWKCSFYSCHRISNYLLTFMCVTCTHVSRNSNFKQLIRIYRWTTDIFIILSSSASPCTPYETKVVKTVQQIFL